MSSSAESDTLYMQPDLLTKISLIHLLEQKCMNIKHLNTMSKEQLVELFQRIALPLPQRKYKQNHRGKLLTKLRNEKEGHKRKSGETPTNVSIGFSESSSVQSTSNLGIGDRLKPPPDAVNFERKKIRLNSGGNGKKSDLDHIQIKKRKSDLKNGLLEDHVKANGEHKTNSLSPQVEEKPNGSSKVVLKRSLSGSIKVSDTAGQEPEKKKEKKLITWP